MPGFWKAAVVLSIVFPAASAAHAKSSTQCTGLGFCYYVNEDLRPIIDRHIADLRTTILAQRDLGKAIGYISVRISTVEGSYAGVDIDASADVSARLGGDFVWTLNSGAGSWKLPDNATGVDYMFMWTTSSKARMEQAPTSTSSISWGRRTLPCC